MGAEGSRKPMAYRGTHTKNMLPLKKQKTVAKYFTMNFSNVMNNNHLFEEST